MEGESSRPVKKSKPSNECKRLTDFEGHLSGRIQSRMSYPLFPGSRKFSRLPWLSKLTSNISISMRAIIRKWHLQKLVTHAKHYNEIHMDWAAMGALVELWHPQTHTFIFPTFEATILLEEAELLLGVKKFQRNGKVKVMRMLRRVTSEEVLRSFMPSEAIKGVQTQKGIHLQKLADWVINALERLTSDDDHIEGLMKGFTICLVDALLFPYTDNIVEEDQLSAICGIWEGKRVGPAILAYLYSGLTASSMGKPPFGCALLLNCWTDLHFKFNHREGMSSTSKLFQQSPLHHMVNVLGSSGSIANRVPWLKKREDWRAHFSTIEEYMLTRAPICLLPYELLTRSSLNMELQLVGASEFILYNTHRCHTQMGLPRHSFPLLSELPLIRKRELGTGGDARNVKTIKASWKASIALRATESVSEDEELLKAYVIELGKLRPEMPKP